MPKSITVDRVYAVLSKVYLEGEFTVDCPSGGQLAVEGRPAGGDVHVGASDNAALWDLTRLLVRFGPGVGFRSLRYLRNPLLQIVTVSVAGRALIRWEPERTPRVLSLSGLLGWIRDRG